ncbi:hypothetical protein BD560DRAFT_435774 [Blakeslea trispora]|nr:hypothetical protein BD560DRAFT_435774 [Blakeslea trispora]
MSNSTISNVESITTSAVAITESSSIEPTTTSAIITSSDIVPTTSSVPESISYTTSTRPSTRASSSSSAYTQNSSPTSTRSNVESRSSSNIGPIVGGVVGGVGGLLLLALGIFLVYKFCGCCGKGGGSKKRNDKDSADKHGMGSYEYDMDYNSYAASGPPTRQPSANRTNALPATDTENQYTPRPFVPAYDPIAAKEGATYNTKYKEILTGDHDLYSGRDYLQAPNQYETYGQNRVPRNNRNVPNEMDSSDRYIPNEI